ncbi:MAG: hypothetical protein KOO60_07535 [Gemmatimonadales bacterium]|nr:hypothetical protein [Gemmatimonadales bacterium]
MTLANSISQVLEYTIRLQAALVVQDEALQVELLELRGQAMARFEGIHKSAEPDEKAECRPLLEKLLEADQTLQTACNGDLSQLTSEFRKKANSGPSSQIPGYNTTPQNACLNRKA